MSDIFLKNLFNIIPTGFQKVVSQFLPKFHP